MSLNLAEYKKKAHQAVKEFWGNREEPKARQIASGRADQGERSGVTSGKNMDGFLSLIIDIIRLNGLDSAQIHINRAMLKSQVGSFGNNFNNRTEEAIGTAHDLWTAYREGALGNQTRPFVGWLMMVEDSVASRKAVRDASPHFPVFAEFQGASYLNRYDLLCQKLVKEGLYTSACLLVSPRDAVTSGEFSELSPMTSLKTFVTSLAGHIASESARLS
jgi:type II restriction enzyme